ncbi:hypothetical protein MPER_06187, partial [Moniliophthora perniciosa FA553]
MKRQRKRFKDDVRNVGKPYTGGLFGLARHINYGGYMLWRTGFAIAAEKYGIAWTNYKRQVPYKLLPAFGAIYFRKPQDDAK